MARTIEISGDEVAIVLKRDGNVRVEGPEERLGMISRLTVVAAQNELLPALLADVAWGFGDESEKAARTASDEIRRSVQKTVECLRSLPYATVKVPRGWSMPPPPPPLPAME
jgi:hypothetical protein